MLERVRSVALVVVIVAVAAACGDDSSKPSNAGTDASVKDSGTPDAATPPKDAGMKDAAVKPPKHHPKDAAVMLEDDAGAPKPDAQVDAAISDDDAGELDAGIDAATDAGNDAGDQTPTFTKLYADLFSPSCAMLCHKPGNMFYTQSQLDMSSQVMAYDSLVGVTAMGTSTANPPGCANMNLMRVVASHPEQSLLIQKLEGTGEADKAVCGSRMPFGGPKLTQDQIDAVSAWISAGALP